MEQSTSKVHWSIVRRLRTSTTKAERRLGHELRRLPVRGTHFRRQVVLRRYVVDFVCHGAKLIIEVDGGQHAEDEAARRDARRTRWLESQGYRVLCFWNSDVERNMPAVLEAIYNALCDPKGSEQRP